MNITAEQVAWRYVDVLRDWLSIAEFMKVVTGEAYNEHDFCDANMAVDQAFNDLGVKVDTQNDEHLVVWNDATARSTEILHDLSHCCGAVKSVTDLGHLYCKKCFEEV